MDKLEFVVKEFKSPCFIPSVISFPGCIGLGCEGVRGSVVRWLNVGTGASLLGFESQVCGLGERLPSLCLCFLTCKMGRMTVPTLWGLQEDQMSSGR